MVSVPATAAAIRRLQNDRRDTLERSGDSFPISTREHTQIIEALARRAG